MSCPDTSVELIGGNVDLNRDLHRHCNEHWLVTQAEQEREERESHVLCLISSDMKMSFFY